MLETERDADDGDAADKTEDEVRRGDLPPPQQDPKHIHEYAEAALADPPVSEQGLPAPETALAGPPVRRTGLSAHEEGVRKYVVRRMIDN